MRPTHSKGRSLQRSPGEAEPPSRASPPVLRSSRTPGTNATRVPLPDRKKHDLVAVAVQ